MKDKISLCYIDEEDNKMCGVLIASKKTQNKLPILKKRRVYYIDDIIVDQTCRRRKIATKLYNYLKEVARKDQIDAILLNVWAFNKEAIKFYQSLGMNVQKMTFEYFLKK